MTAYPLRDAMFGLVSCGGLLTKYILLYEHFFFGLLVYDTVPILHLISSLGTILDYFPPSSSAPSFFLISTYSFIPHLVSRIPCPLIFYP